jgi:hypothetical protein
LAYVTLAVINNRLGSRMGNVYDMNNMPLGQKSGNEKLAEGEEAFLLDEGLELLALYRAIPDPAVRRALFQMIEVLAIKSIPEAAP